MDASNPNALTPQEFQSGIPNWRTDLYATGGTLLSHQDSIQQPSFGTQAVYLDDRYETITPPLDPKAPDTWKPTESNSPLEQSLPILFWDNRCPSRSIAHHIRAIFAHS